MMSENLPPAPTPTRRDASRSVQVPLHASFGASSGAPFDMAPFHPAAYPISGPSHPSFGPLQNCASPAPAPFSTGPCGPGNYFFVPYQGYGTTSHQTSPTTNPIFPPPHSSFPATYGSDNASLMPYHQSQGNVSPEVNVAGPMFLNNHHFPQGSFYPFAGMLHSSATTGFLPSGGNSHHVQGFPPLQRPIAIRPPAAATQQQAQYQPVHNLPVRESSQEPGSPNGENCQPDVAFHVHPSSSTPEATQRDQLENKPGSSLPMRSTASKARRKAKAQTNATKRGSEKYHCEECDKWVPLHRKKIHEKSHVSHYMCKICEVLHEKCTRLSRKDSLKRHIKEKHKEFQHLLEDDSDPLGLLVPQSKNSTCEDLTLLKQAMFSK